MCCLIFDHDSRGGLYFAKNISIANKYYTAIMSSSESDNSDTSYQSDDSDVNFIPEYVIEDAELNDGNREYSIDPELEDDGCSGIAYADEPLADEAWLETYHKEEQERLEVEEKLGKRLNGSVDISEW